MRRTLGRFNAWLLTPESPEPLALFRVAVALFCLVRLFVTHGHFTELHGQYGFIQWAITAANLYPGLPHLGDLANLLALVGISPDQTVQIVECVYIGVLLGVLFGLFTRGMAILLWIVHFLLIHASGGLTYGMDMFTHVALLYCAIMPVGDAFSIDAWRKKKPPTPSVAAGLTRHMLQIQLCIIYASAGFEKALGIQWWNGEAMWRSAMLPTFRQFNLEWMAWNPWVPMLAGWLTIAVELGYPVFIWGAKTRKIWLVSAILMHLGIGLFLGMWLFGIIMVLLNLGAFGFGPITRPIPSRRKAGFPSSDRTATG